jgi:uncharacterized oxidoreductase
MLSILVDPAPLDSGGVFGEETRAFLDAMRKTPVAPGFDKVRIAGEPERETRAKREKEGIPVDQATWNEIQAAADKLGLSRDIVQRLAEGR